MGARSMTYAVITPARDEAENLRRLGGSLTAQTIQPGAWIIVDNGSGDETLDVARALAHDVNWARALSRPGEPQAAPGAPVVRAFRAGLEALSELPDVIVKLDADVSMEPDYFERHLAAFGGIRRSASPAGRVSSSGLGGGPRPMSPATTCVERPAHTAASASRRFSLWKKEWAGTRSTS